MKCRGKHWQPGHVPPASTVDGVHSISIQNLWSLAYGSKIFRGGVTHEVQFLWVFRFLYIENRRIGDNTLIVWKP